MTLPDRSPHAQRPDSLAAGFLRSAEAFPERTAFETRGRAWTYGEVDECARRWAGALFARIDRAPARIGVLADRNEASFIGILASLLTGAAFVPLNPRFPAARTRAMVEAAELDAVIVDDASRELLNEVLEGLASAPAVLAPGAEDLDAATPVVGWPTVAPDAVAYLLFTSGSTGRPKGVPIRHTNMLHFVEVNQQRYGFTQADRFSQVTDLTFDISLFDVFLAWNCGASFCVAQPIEMFAPARFVSKHALTVWFSVPSVISMLRKKNLLAPGSMPSLRWSLFCGEALPAASAEAWAAAAPGGTLENLYGPTEATIACLVHRWDPASSPAACHNGVVPIGRPYPGLAHLVVDDALEPLPCGQDGELCIGGAQTFAGYWNDAGKSAAALFERTLDGRTVRFYRTGDRVRELPGGEHVFLGRLDHQVKVRGYRVELGEVEAALRALPGVVDAVALGWPMQDYSAEGIVALVTGTDVDPDASMAQLETQLPTHVLPREVRVLEAMPLNENGKIDRQQLARRLDDGA